MRYNEKDKCIEINDGIKSYYFILKMVFCLTLINSVLYPFFILDSNEELIFVLIWAGIGFSSIVLLMYLILKKSVAEKIQLSEIDSIAEKQLFGRKRLSLKLKNGKTRDFLEIKTQSDIERVKELLEGVGVSVS